MARVYLFNPQANEVPTPLFLSALVNGSPIAYELDFSLERSQFVPASTSGQRTPGGAPSGNEFALHNSILVEEPEGPIQYPSVTLPEPTTADLILYISRNHLLLLNTFGVVIAEFPELTPETPFRLSRRDPIACGDEASDIVLEAEGQIFVFNVFSEPMITFSVNGMSVGTIDGWSGGGGGEPSIFTPAVLPVLRSTQVTPGRFGDGDNIVVFTWPSATRSITVPVQGGFFPVIQNLLLYIFRNRWYLTTTFGAIVESGPIDPGGATSPCDETSPQPQTRRTP